MKAPFAVEVQLYSSDIGAVRIGADGQIVSTLTHKTIASSDAAHDWIRNHVRGADRAAMLRSTRPPGGMTYSPIDNIAGRRNKA